jgi:hypothetical protein
MDEQSLNKKHHEFMNLKKFCRTLSEALGKLPMGPVSQT